MITAEEVIKSLPRILKEKPQIKWEIYEILSQEFLRKTEFYEYMKKSDEKFEKIFQELRAIREDSNIRFEEINRRFEEMRKDMDLRFEEINRRFEEMRKDMDRRFEEMRKDMDLRFEEVYRRFDKVDSDFKDLKDWVGLVVGGFQRRAGRNLEDTVAGTLKIALNKKDIKPEHIIMRKKITDDEGLIGPKGRTYEIDLYITNSETLIFEIKSYAEEEDVVRFNDKAELAIKKLNLKNVEKAFITLEKHPSVVNLCHQLGITIG